MLSARQGRPLDEHAFFAPRAPVKPMAIRDLVALGPAMTSLPREIGIAVIGGGIVGLCLGWFLAEAGADVAVLDDGRHAGTTTNAGSLHVQMQSRFMRLYPELVAGLERALPFYPRAVAHWAGGRGAARQRHRAEGTGGLMVAESRGPVRLPGPKCGREQKLGLEVEMLDRAALDRIAPYLGAVDRRRRALRRPKASSIRCWRTRRSGASAIAAGAIHCAGDAASTGIEP